MAATPTTAPAPTIPRNPRIERIDTLMKVVAIIALATIAICAVVIGVTAAQYLPAAAPLYSMIPIPLSFIALALVDCRLDQVFGEERIDRKQYYAQRFEAGRVHNHPSDDDSSDDG